LSLVTRLLGFGLCLLGSFLIGYVQGIQSILPNIDGMINFYGGSVSNLAAVAAAATASYTQQNVNPWLSWYWVGGIPMVVGGFILIAMRDRKPKKAREWRGPGAPEARPMPVKKDRGFSALSAAQRDNS
jgi:MFS family permease